MSHSKYAPSSAHRWLACPGCIQLASKAPPGESSEYAREGSAAHALAEECLNEPDAHDAHTRDWVGCDFEGVVVTDEMARAVQKYIDYVDSRIPDCDQYDIERRVSSEFSGVKIFGTSDAVIATDFGMLEIVDYKHGSGKMVEAQDNPQLILYALMTMDEMPDFEFDFVRTTIVQPRKPHPDGPIRSAVYTLDEMTEWRKKFEDAVTQTQLKPDTYVSGSHCHWCDGISICPRLRREVDETAANEFDPDSLTPEQFAAELEKENRVLEYFKNLKKHAASLLADGLIEIPGYKAVQGFGHPKWTDPEAVAKQLRNKKFKAADVWEKKLISPSKALKLFGEPYREFIEANSERKKTNMLLVKVKDKIAEEDFNE